MPKNSRESRDRLPGDAAARPAENKVESAWIEREIVDTLQRFVEESDVDLPEGASPEQAEGGALPDVSRQPPWGVVQRYLTRGEHRAWVEGHAQTSTAFADVIEALRHDQRERVEREERQRARRPSASRARERPSANEAGGRAAPRSTEPPQKTGVVLKLRR